MSPRIAYWTSAFEADIEGVAGEVACLREAFPGSVTWGVSRRRVARLSLRRGFSVHPRLHWAFRGATWLLQRAFDLNHLFGSVGDWFHLRAVRRGPTVLTLAVRTPPCNGRLLEKVDRFIAECPADRERLGQFGIEPGRTRLVFPPVDLDRFRPAPPPAGPFTVLFASSPERSDWLEARGVGLILEAAALRPRTRFRLLWRPWGDSAALVRQWIEQRALTNVELNVQRIRSMAGQYQQAHVTIAPFTNPDRCKPAPNSVVESLACGRPVLVTEAVGLADLVRDAGAGLVCTPSGEALAEHLDRMQREWLTYSARARELAQKHFAVDRFIAAYERIYRELM